MRILLSAGMPLRYRSVSIPAASDVYKRQVDEEGKEELEEALTAEEYEMITASTKFRIKWFFLGDSSDD